MQTLNSLVPFVGILAAVWTLGALVFAIFPGNRKRRLKSSGIAFAVFIAAIIGGPSIERAASDEELRDAGVSSRQELLEMRGQEEAEQAAAAVDSYSESIAYLLDSTEEWTVSEFTESHETILFFLALVDVVTEAIEDGQNMELNSEQAQARQALRQLLSRRQAQIFPAIRDAYGPILRQRLWEHDGYVRTIGTGYRRIEIVNGAFAANRNIADFHQSVRDTLLQLRFTRVDYKWFREAREFSYYTLEPPTDGTVGRWNGARFSPVE